MAGSQRWLAVIGGTQPRLLTATHAVGPHGSTPHSVVEPSKGNRALFPNHFLTGEAQIRGLGVDVKEIARAADPFDLIQGIICTCNR